MPTPTDRGYVTVTENRDGTKTVSVSESVERGVPSGVFAEYVRVSVVDVAEVAVRDAGKARSSVGIAQVYADDEGVVHVDRVSGM